MSVEGQQVRKTISLKLRDQLTTKVEVAPVVKKELVVGDVGSEDKEEEVMEVNYDMYKWDHVVNMIGRPVKDPLLHLCEQCTLPVLIYGRMKRCRHAFCRDCAKKSNGVCPRCKESNQVFEEASIGSVYVCTYGGGRYNNSGCGRSYLSQRDLDAHVLYRHNKDKVTLATNQQSHPPTAALPAGFTLPPFFQPGMLQGLPPPPPPPPPGYNSALRAPPNIGAAMLRPSMMPGSLHSPALGAVSTLGVAMRPGQPTNIPPVSLPPNSLRPSSLGTANPAIRPPSNPTPVPVSGVPFSIPPNSM